MSSSKSFLPVFVVLLFGLLFVVSSISALPPSEAFKKCCEKIVPPLRPDTIKDECKFVPNNPSTDEAIDLAHKGHYNAYIKCYTNGKDNRECCRQHHVVGKFAICQVLCDGTHEHPHPSPEMYMCESIYVKGNISACNEAAYPPVVMTGPRRIPGGNGHD